MKVATGCNWISIALRAIGNISVLGVIFVLTGTMTLAPTAIFLKSQAGFWTGMTAFTVIGFGLGVGASFLPLPKQWLNQDVAERIVRRVPKIFRSSGGFLITMAMLLYVGPVLTALWFRWLKSSGKRLILASLVSAATFSPLWYSFYNGALSGVRHAFSL